ncbi:hypothetical protein STEG23_025147 [Scotinomys teguina]
MVAAIAIMVKDAGKLTLGQPLTVIAPHAVESLVKQPPDWWMLNAHMTHYQALLLDTDQVQFSPVNSLKPAALLPVPGGLVPHDCQQIFAETHGTPLDLADQPQRGADLTWYTDGSSYLLQGEGRGHNSRWNQGDLDKCLASGDISTASGAHCPYQGPTDGRRARPIEIGPQKEAGTYFGICREKIGELLSKLNFGIFVKD